MVVVVLLLLFCWVFVVLCVCVCVCVLLLLLFLGGVGFCFEFVSFALASQRIIMKTQNIESRCVTGPENLCYRTGKSTVWRHVPASFIPEILQAGAVKGLMTVSTVGLIDRPLRLRKI